MTSMPFSTRLSLPMVVVLMALLAPRLSAQRTIRYGWSDNFQYGVRIVPGDFNGTTAQAVVLKFDADARHTGMSRTCRWTTSTVRWKRWSATTGDT